MVLPVPQETRQVFPHLKAPTEEADQQVRLTMVPVVVAAHRLLAQMAQVRQEEMEVLGLHRLFLVHLQPTLVAGWGPVGGQLGSG